MLEDSPKVSAHKGRNNAGKRVLTITKISDFDRDLTDGL